MAANNSPSDTPTLDLMIGFAQTDRRYPGLAKALKALAAFVGLKDVKESVAGHVQSILSLDMASSGSRRSPVLTRLLAKTLTQPRKRKAKRKQWTRSKQHRPSAAKRRKTQKVLMMEHLDMVSRALMETLDESDSDYDSDSDDTVQSCRAPHLRSLNLHTLLLGAPGTGKTSLALVLAHIWATVGLVKPGLVSVVTRTDLIGKYQGHSTDKVRKVLAAHQNGVLFIDEAYSLVTDDKDSFGAEVLAQIVESMMNPDCHVTFIMAGYERAIKTALLQTNEGLERRFGAIHCLTKPDATQSAAIFHALVGKATWRTQWKKVEALHPFFRQQADTFRFAGGDLENLVSHAQRAHIKRMWPAGLTKRLKLEDLQAGHKTFMRDKQRTATRTPSTAHLYL